MSAERTREENLRLGIINIQGLFLERYPEFDLLFPRAEDNMITEDKREEARRFIMGQIGTRAKFRKIFGPGIISGVPTFNNSVHTALIQTFEPWGIQFNPPNEWVSNKSLAEETGKDPEMIRGLANRFRQDHPEEFRTYRGEKKPMQFYSPSLVDFIKQESSNNETPPKEWLTPKRLFYRLRLTLETTKKIAEELSKNHPEWYRVVRAQGGPRTYYSQELAEEIRRMLDNTTIISPEEANEQLRRLLDESINEELVQTQIKPQVSSQEIIPEDFGDYLDSYDIPEGYWTPEKIEATALFVYQRKGTLNRLHLRKDGLEDAIRRNYPGGYPTLLDKLGISLEPLVDEQSNIYIDKQGKEWTHASILGQMFGLAPLPMSRILGKAGISTLQGGSKNLQTVTLYELEEARKILKESGYEEKISIEDISAEEANKQLRRLLEEQQ